MYLRFFVIGVYNPYLRVLYIIKPLIGENGYTIPEISESFFIAAIYDKICG